MGIPYKVPDFFSLGDFFDPDISVHQNPKYYHPENGVVF
jgi:hypothetical protein